MGFMYLVVSRGTPWFSLELLTRKKRKKHLVLAPHGCFLAHCVHSATKLPLDAHKTHSNEFMVSCFV